MKKKIALVNLPAGERLVIRDCCNSTAKAEVVMPQTMLASVAAMLRQSQSDVNLQFYDCVARGLDRRSLVEKLRREQPHYLITNSAITSLASDLLALRAVKSACPSLQVIMFGSSVTTQARMALVGGIVDYGVVGEPENTIVELLTALSTQTDLSAINGLALIKDGQLSLTAPRQLIEDLDQLPWPAYDLLEPFSGYRWPLLRHRPFMTVWAARGCPYSCTFCHHDFDFASPRLRWRSVEKIVEELEYLRRAHGVAEIVFRDGVFTANKKRLLEFCHQLSQRKLRLLWSCEARADQLDQERLVAMKQAGCHLIFLGVEAGDDEILRQAKKKLTVAQIEEGFALCRAAQIDTGAHFVFGLPGETPATLEKSRRLAKKLRPRYASFNVAVPYPGTEFYVWLKERNLLRTDDFSLYDQSGLPVFDLPQLSAEDIFAATQQAYREFYNLRYALKAALRLRSLEQMRSATLAGAKLWWSLLRR